jgi:hypothetical protein
LGQGAASQRYENNNGVKQAVHRNLLEELILCDCPKGSQAHSILVFL